MLIFIGILVYRKLDDFKLLLRKYFRMNWEKCHSNHTILLMFFFCVVAEEISKYTLFLAVFGSVLCAISCHGCYCVFTKNKHVLTAVSGFSFKQKSKERSDVRIRFQFMILLVSLIMFEIIVVIYLKITYTGLLDDVPERLGRTFAKIKKDRRYRDLWQTLQTNVRIRKIRIKCYF